MHNALLHDFTWANNKEQKVRIYITCCKNLIRRRDGKCSKSCCVRLCSRVRCASARSATAWTQEAKGLSAFAARQTVGGVWGRRRERRSKNIFMSISQRPREYTRRTKAESVFCTRALAPTTKSRFCEKTFLQKRNIYKSMQTHTKITHCW